MQINRTKDRIYESALYLANKYPMLCSMNMKKKSGLAEVRLRDKRFSKTKKLVEINIENMNIPNCKSSKLSKLSKSSKSKKLVEINIENMNIPKCSK